MTAITDAHVEWAVVGRLRAMIEEEPHGRFNVTQSFSLCASILCWVMQRVRARGRNKDVPPDWASSLFAKWEKASLTEAPWGGAVVGPSRIVRASGSAVVVPQSVEFETHTIARFLINLRDACAHGDKRTVVPFNHRDELIGFTFRCSQPSKHPGWVGSVTLVESDVRAIGAWAAMSYCDALRHSEAHRRDSNFGGDAKSVKEVKAA